MFSGTPCISDHCQHIIIDSSQVNKNTVYILFFFLVLQHSTALGENKIKMELNHDMFLMCLQVYIKHEVMWWCWHWSAVRVCRITIISSVCREDKSEQLQIGDSSLLSLVLLLVVTQVEGGDCIVVVLVVLVVVLVVVVVVVVVVVYFIRPFIVADSPTLDNPNLE